MATSRYNGVQHPGLFPGPPAPARSRRSPAEIDDQALRVAALERERTDVQQELFEAAQVQRRLSGPRRLRRGPFEIASEVFPVKHLAGDFVCTMDIGDKTWIAIGDIAGKGLAAAMWFTHLVSLIRCYGAANPCPAAVVSSLNEDLCGLQPEPPLTSVVLLVLDPAKGCLEYCNGGHPAPLLLRHIVPTSAKPGQTWGTTEKLETGGPLLGVVVGAHYGSARLSLHTGDVILGCTDGIEECRNADDEEFGNARLLQSVRQHAGDPAQTVLFSILGEVRDFAGSTPRSDDISLLVLRHAGESRN